MRKMKLMLAAWSVVVAALPVLADNSTEALRAIDDIKQGKDSVYMIQKLRVAPGGDVIFPNAAIGTSEVSNNAITAAKQPLAERKTYVNITAVTATWTQATPATAVIQLQDVNGNSVTGRQVITAWTATSSFGTPSATSTGVTTWATGSIIVPTNSSSQTIRILTDTSGLARWSILTAATGQFHVVAAAGDSVGSAALNLQ